MRKLISILCTLCAACSFGADLYQPFIWISHDQNGHRIEKAAILIPIEIEGCDRRLYAQLDTGTDLSSFYGPALRNFGITVDSVLHPNLHFKWCNFEDDYDSLGTMSFLRWDMGRAANPKSDDPSHRIVATIGLDRIVGKILILDFPNTRFAVQNDTAAVPSAVRGSVHYEKAAVLDYKFYVDIIIGNDTLKWVRFDSGSSSETLIVPLAEWRRVTGLQGDEVAIIKDSVPSWGKYVHIWKAPARESLAFGPIRIDNPEITFVDWSDENLRNMSFLGNAPFADSFIIVIDCIREQFGVALPR